MPEGRVHVLDAYAMANLLLCSAVAEGKTTSKATPAMRRNCAGHLAATIEILQPTLVISQGKTLVEPLMSLFERPRQQSERVWRASARGTSFVWVPLHHPTYNWDWLARPYLQSEVAPAITEARRPALSES
jgi:uracil-DNA glycosylase